MFDLRKHFMLDPQVVFLNHGSFGATPRSVFMEYQRWQRELESQPVAFLGRRFTELMQTARESLAGYLQSEPKNTVYTPNVTVSINIVARSLDLRPGDEVLSTDHEYGACDRTWRFLAKEKGFTYKRQTIPVPIDSPQAFVETLWRGVTSNTKVIFLSHITSPTALIFPAAEVCKKARKEGILTIVDGAHAPGQIPLNMESLGADFYGGNLHKWLCAPKGAGFLYARSEAQNLIKPLIVSWGYESETPSDSTFIDINEWTGTRDIAAYLSVRSAIEFQKTYDWPKVRKACHELAMEAQEKILSLGKLPSISANDSWFGQFVSIPLPQETDIVKLKKDLYGRFKVEVPLIRWNDRNLIRVSFQGYNTSGDLMKLVEALRFLL